MALVSHGSRKVKARFGRRMARESCFTRGAVLRSALSMRMDPMSACSGEVCGRRCHPMARKSRSSPRGPGGGIFVMNANGSGVTQLVSNEFANPGWGDYGVELPSWSPDGRSIAFVRANYEDPWTVHIIDLATSQISLVNVGVSVGDSRPDWSPDGTRLLLQLPFWEIASVNRDGSGLQKYVEAAYVGTPDWSPVGKSIVFERFTGSADQSSPAGSRMRIFLANLADGSVRQLIPEATAPALPDYWDSEPAWSRVRR